MCVHILLLCLVNSRVHLRDVALTDEANSQPQDGMVDRWQQAYGLDQSSATVATDGDVDEALEKKRAILDKHPDAATLRKYASQSTKWRKRRKKSALTAYALRQIRQEPHELQKLLSQRLHR